MTTASRTEYQLRRHIVQIGRRLHEQGMISGADGNVSVRLTEDKILVTPSGVAKAELVPRDLVVVDLRGRPYGRGRPSSELGMHLALYDLRTDVTAAIHAHPAWVIAASLQPNLRFDFSPEGILALAGVIQIPYTRPGTPAVAEGLRPVLLQGNSFVLTRHGSLTLGKDLDEAFRRLENLEHNAKIALLALAGGDLTALPPEEVEQLESAAKSPNAPREPKRVRGFSRVKVSDEESLVEELIPD